MICISVMFRKFWAEKKFLYQKQVLIQVLGKKFVFKFIIQEIQKLSDKYFLCYSFRQSLIRKQNADTSNKSLLRREFRPTS